MSAVQFKCPMCGEETKFQEVTVGCRVYSDIVEVQDDRLELGEVTAGEGGHVVGYRCRACESWLLHEGTSNPITDGDEIIGWLRSHGMLAGEPPRQLRFKVGDIVIISKSTAEVQIMNPPIRARVLDASDGSGKLDYDYQLVEVDAQDNEISGTFEINDEDIEGPAATDKANPI